MASWLFCRLVVWSNSRAGCLVEHYIGCTDCPVTLGPAHPRPPLIPPLLSAPSTALLCSLCGTSNPLLYSVWNCFNFELQSQPTTPIFSSFSSSSSSSSSCAVQLRGTVCKVLFKDYNTLLLCFARLNKHIAHIALFWKEQQCQRPPPRSTLY